MKVTVTLERGDAALGTLEFSELMENVSHGVEKAMVETIFRKMPIYYTKAGMIELFGDENGPEMSCNDFDAAAKATILWMLRHFRIGAVSPQVPKADELGQSETIEWPQRRRPSHDQPNPKMDGNCANPSTR